jgi:hypothetical protein
MRTGNDVGRYQTIPNAFAGIRSRAYSRVDSTGFTPDEDGDITATDEFASNEAYFGGFGHGIRRLNGGYQATGFNHTQSNAMFFVGHGLFLLLIPFKKSILALGSRSRSCTTTCRQYRLNFTVRTRNDVCCHQAVTYTFAGIGTGTNRCINSTSFTTNQNGDITTTDKLATNQAYFSGLGHRVRGFNGGYQTTGLNHTQSNAIIFVCHLSIS